MKNLKINLFFFGILLFQTFALFSQTKENNVTNPPSTLAVRTFDPSKDAIGQRLSNDLWVLKISEWTLVNAAKSAIPSIKTVKSITKERVDDKNYLVIACTMVNTENSISNLIIPLRQEFDGKIFIEESRIVCSGKDGCSTNCSAPSCGCCSSEVSSRFALGKWIETE
jgi:hypothetical protein